MTEDFTVNPGESVTQALIRRLLALEQRKLKLVDLPLAALQDQLADNWQPDATRLLQPRSVSLGMLANRISFGSINGGGGVVSAGSKDWTVARTGLGAYTVTFTVPFTTVPVVISSPGNWSVNWGTVLAGSFTATTFTSSTGASADYPWSFLAIG